MSFSYDNENPFTYIGTTSQQQVKCFEISLLSLVLPNEILSSPYGSRIAFYPYVYIELKNITAVGASNNIIYSNNPNSRNMLFRASITDVSNPLSTSFITLKGDGMVQTIKFKPYDNLRFSVRLPSGEIYDTIIEENFSPNSPVAIGQISAVFSLKRT